MNRNYKIALTSLIVLLAVLIFSGGVDNYGRQYTEDGLKRTLVAYGIARGLNGVISVFQGTELAVEPAGVGVIFTPGQILDPINDLIERFSWVVLVSGISLGAQRVLLSMTSWVWFGGFVGMFLLLSLISMWRDQLFGETLKHYIYKMTLVLLVLRLTVPVIAIINEGLFQVFLAPQYEESIRQLESTTQSIESIKQPASVEKDNGLMGKAKQMLQTLNIDQQLEDLKLAASEMSEYALNMMVVFVLQTLVFPLLLLWLAYKSIVRVFAI